MELVVAMAAEAQTAKVEHGVEGLVATAQVRFRRLSAVALRSP